MLSNLSITNYAIIDELDINFERGFNVITGETGAGKSIMLGALSLVIGKRADTSVLFDKEQKCIVEATFDLNGLDVVSFFKQNDLDYEQNTVIRREINAAGKSRAFINDTPVNLHQLNQLTYYLIDIHSQHETLQINASEFQINVLDTYADLREKIEKYQIDFKEYQSSKKILDDLIAQENQSALDLDYFQFQFDELEQMNLQSNEQEELEEESNILNNAEKIKDGLYQVVSGLEQDGGVVEQLRAIVGELSSIKRYSEKLGDIDERLNSAFIEVEDIASEINRIKDCFELDNERLEYVGQRLDAIYKLQQKHRVNSIEELIELKNELEEKLSNVFGLSDKIESLKKSVETQQKELLLQAHFISKQRKEAASRLKSEVRLLLSQLGMPETQFEIKIDELENIGQYGINAIQFLFNANKGGQLTEIAKVASGGELSRLMLSLKTIISSKSNLPTIIFDEIDTGISGAIADKMADIMNRLSEGTQVFSITHLPQIAAKGKTHFVVYKDSESNRTYSRLKRLEQTERVEVIAKMLSGEKVTQAAIDNASALLN